MKVTYQRIDRITVEYGTGFLADGIVPQIPNNYRRSNVWVKPTSVVVEHERDTGRFLSAIVTGQQYRLYASGEIRKVPGRKGGYPEYPTVWEWGPSTTWPAELVKLGKELIA